MSSLMQLIDKTEDLLGHSPHPPIVTVPIGAWVVSNVSDILGAATGDRGYDDTPRISMGIGLIGAAAAVVTGLRDFSAIPKKRPSHDAATRHGLGNAVVGTLFATSYLLRSQDHAVGRRPGLLPRFLGLAGGALALYTAWLGGVLVEEMGEAVKPVQEQRKKQESRQASGPLRGEQPTEAWHRTALGEGR